MWLKWFPWRLLIRYLARSQGFIDPAALLSRLRRFAQPSEVGEPIELLRAGMVFHARGLINSRAIQHNLDWVWPYWIERQFDPGDESFIPRAFSITHVNLSQRNWTALGWPDCDQYPLVDPRGLLTPLYDGWSIDCWIVGDDGQRLLPCRSQSCDQRLILEDGPEIRTETRNSTMDLVTRARVLVDQGQPLCRLDLEAHSAKPAWAVIALRPYNPEGISFIHEITLSADRRRWQVDQALAVVFDRPPERHHASDYHGADVAIHLLDKGEQTHLCCNVGMATAAALYRLEPGRKRSLGLSIPLPRQPQVTLASDGWKKERQSACRLSVPDPHFQFLYDAAITTLILHTPGDAFPGPYTYKRFWFRDAAFILHGLLCAGLAQRAERVLDQFPDRQDRRGYFHSQEGEWDANGEVLWILQRYCELTGRSPKPQWLDAIVKGAQWIANKRLPDDGSPQGGLLPAGFSAEHLGPNDYYYWDDFWGVAGLSAAARLLARHDSGLSKKFQGEANRFQAAIDRSLAQAADRIGRPAMPAAPSRRLDAGAIGSLAAGYPLQLYGPGDRKLLDTVEFLMANCFFRGGFFQDMIHSGINAYLTLHIAQILLRAGDPRSLTLMETVAELASATGQWPEAIHPRTLGGCMGDGQHAWAAAEWVLMQRNGFVREEGDSLVLASGIPERWRQPGQEASFGPAPTTFGPVTVRLTTDSNGHTEVHWDGNWRQQPPVIRVQLPGQPPVTAAPNQSRLGL